MFGLVIMKTAVWSLELGLEVVEVDQAAAVALDRDRLEAGQVRRGGVGAVGTVGDQDLRALSRPGRGNRPPRPAGPSARPARRPPAAG